MLSALTDCTSIASQPKHVTFCFFRRNEELDDKVVIKRLKRRVSELEQEIQQLRESSGHPEVKLRSFGH